MTESLPGPPCLIGATPRETWLPLSQRQLAWGSFPVPRLAYFSLMSAVRRETARDHASAGVTVPRGSCKQVTTIRWLEM